MRTVLCILTLLLVSSTVTAQREVPRFEIGAQFSLLSLQRPREIVGNGQDPCCDRVVPGNGKRTEPGVGGRFTYNLTSSLAFEAEGNLFPKNETDGSMPGGRMFQGQFGIKAGKRFQKFGIFGKARPGFVGFTEVSKLLSTSTIGPSGPLNQVFTVGTFGTRKDVYFSTDLGGVVEFYPSRRIVTRFDVGDTIIRYGIFHRAGFILSRAIIERGPETKHNLQFSAGVGFRF
ncbi:MAG TPA: hypothetical protein VK475_08245 [Pyrinomonadaceae bacterium]|nr:hypothetical protein [Pyrinomonadaceae bacterium]